MIRPFWDFSDRDERVPRVLRLEGQRPPIYPGHESRLQMVFVHGEVEGGDGGQEGG